VATLVGLVLVLVVLRWRLRRRRVIRDAGLSARAAVPVVDSGARFPRSPGRTGQRGWR
jgi:hypothetical protein